MAAEVRRERTVRWIELENGERLKFDPPVSIYQAMVRKYYAENPTAN